MSYTHIEPTEATLQDGKSAIDYISGQFIDYLRTKKYTVPT